MKKGLILMMLGCLLLAGCGKRTGPAQPSPIPGSQSGTLPAQTLPYAEGAELFGAFDSEAGALEAAELYQIEFLSYEYGIATFHTEENPADVIRRGSENGWPHIEINYLNQAHDKS